MTSMNILTTDRPTPHSAIDYSSLYIHKICNGIPIVGSGIVFMVYIDCSLFEQCSQKLHTTATYITQLSRNQGLYSQRKQLNQYSPTKPPGNQGGVLQVVNY